METKRTRGDATIEGDPRWEAVCARDPRADGRFVYAVRSTGIYCRPSCASRRARAENVEFHASPATAEAAGYRACKRCRPSDARPESTLRDRVVAMCRAIEGGDRAPSLEELARIAGTSPFHAHRLFRESTGLTPRAYAASVRSGRMREELTRASSVTAARVDAGYVSTGRFYEETRSTLGMTPSEFRAGGASVRIRFAVGECSLGSVLVAATDVGLAAVLLGDSPEPLVEDLERRFPRATIVGADPGFDDWVAQVVALVEHPERTLELPLDIRGTAFQRRVWEALRAVPPGTTTTYSALAEALSAPSSVRAIAGACAANPIAIAIPCHRVVRRDGDLAGYRWGIDRKRELLRRESSR